MKRQLCVESRLSALSAANLTFNGLIDRFGPWLPGCITQIPERVQTLHSLDLTFMNIEDDHVNIEIHEILKPAITGFYIRFHPLYRALFLFATETDDAILLTTKVAR
jgi:hypothetical protein